MVPSERRGMRPPFEGQGELRHKMDRIVLPRGLTAVRGLDERCVWNDIYLASVNANPGAAAPVGRAMRCAFFDLSQGSA